MMSPVTASASIDDGSILLVRFTSLLWQIMQQSHALVVLPVVYLV